MGYTNLKRKKWYCCFQFGNVCDCSYKILRFFRISSLRDRGSCINYVIAANDLGYDDCLTTNSKAQIWYIWSRKDILSLSFFPCGMSQWLQYNIQVLSGPQTWWPNLCTTPYVTWFEWCCFYSKIVAIRASKDEYCHISSLFTQETPDSSYLQIQS